MDLRDVLFTIRRHWLLAVLAFDLFAGLALAAAFLPTPRYEATALVLGSSRGQGNAIQESAFEMPIIERNIRSRSLREITRENVGPEFSDAAVSIGSATVPGSAVVEVQARSTSPEAAAAWATTAARQLVDEHNGRETNLLDLRVSDPATVPGEPVSPNQEPILIAGVALGLMAAVIVPVGFSRLGQVLDWRREIQERADAPILAEVPSLRSLRRGRSPLDLSARDHAAFTESMQMLRAALEVIFLARGGRLLAVTSGGQREGKTTVTAGLATALATGGRRVLAVDTDLRAPGLHRRFDEPLHAGMAQLDEVPDARELVVATTVPNLSIVTGGILHTHPADVLAPGLRRLAEETHGDRDVVLFDTPTLGLAPEMPLILSAAGSVVLVLDQANLQLRDVEREIERVHALGAEVVGVVINRARFGWRRRRQVDQRSTRRAGRRGRAAGSDAGDPDPVAVPA